MFNFLLRQQDEYIFNIVNYRVGFSRMLHDCLRSKHSSYFCGEGLLVGKMLSSGYFCNLSFFYARPRNGIFNVANIHFSNIKVSKCLGKETVKCGGSKINPLGTCSLLCEGLASIAFPNMISSPFKFTEV